MSTKTQPLCVTLERAWFFGEPTEAVIAEITALASRHADSGYRLGWAMSIDGEGDPLLCLVGQRMETEQEAASRVEAEKAELRKRLAEMENQ